MFSKMWGRHYPFFYLSQTNYVRSNLILIYSRLSLCCVQIIVLHKEYVLCVLTLSIFTLLCFVYVLLLYRFNCTEANCFRVVLALQG